MVQLLAMIIIIATGRLTTTRPGVRICRHDLDQCAVSTTRALKFFNVAFYIWGTVRRSLELAVIDEEGAHALVFACRRVADGWIKAETGERINVHPSHWREWMQKH